MNRKSERQPLRHPRLLESLYGIAWKFGARFAAPKGAHRSIFGRIYADNAWGSAESRSGPGSTRERGAELHPALIELLNRHSITSMLDAPCGDFNWLPGATAGLASYIGVDIVDELIETNQQKHGDGRHRFLCRDLTRDPLPKADLILCRDALIHFSFSDIWSALANFRRCGSQFLLATTFVDLARNVDIPTGGWRPLNLQADPFRLPEPIALIDDIPRGNLAPDKRLGLWKVESLPVDAARWTKAR